MIYSTDFNHLGIIFLDFANNILLLSKKFSKFLVSIFLIFRTNIVYILSILCMQDKIRYNLKKKVIAIFRHKLLMKM